MEKTEKGTRKCFSGDKIISLKNVWKVYKMGEVLVPALKDVTVDIHEGDFVAIVGASGSGKSTMMNMVGCLDTPTKGEVYLKSKNISKMPESELASLRGRAIGFIFQQYNLMPHMTAYENVILPLEFHGYDDETAHKRVVGVLNLVGLAGKMYNRPSQMSGGEQQRVSIARCLVTDPDIILADEPTGALDSVRGKEVLTLLQKLWKEKGKTVIMVTHDLNLARMACSVIELKDGEIVSSGPLKEALRRTAA
ncbi:MAG: ABC transporter ATP-binding protein [Candidatus Aenigmarchaeota archaeon]|nr:ABC transporter ATP-binding protein [Candidatus Aenigmarchaeota archaeon]